MPCIRCGLKWHWRNPRYGGICAGGIKCPDNGILSDAGCVSDISAVRSHITVYSRCDCCRWLILVHRKSRLSVCVSVRSRTVYLTTRIPSRIASCSGGLCLPRTDISRRPDVTSRPGCRGGREGAGMAPWSAITHVIVKPTGRSAQTASRDICPCRLSRLGLTAHND